MTFRSGHYERDLAATKSSLAGTLGTGRTLAPKTDAPASFDRIGDRRTLIA